MKQSKINLKEGVTILAVEVPDDCNVFDIVSPKIASWEDSKLACWHDTTKETPHLIDISGGPKEILGRFIELSEEQCAELIESEEHVLMHDHDYVWPK